MIGDRRLGLGLGIIIWIGIWDIDWALELGIGD